MTGNINVLSKKDIDRIKDDALIKALHYIKNGTFRTDTIAIVYRDNLIKELTFAQSLIKSNGKKVNEPPVTITTKKAETIAKSDKYLYAYWNFNKVEFATEWCDKPEVPLIGKIPLV